MSSSEPDSSNGTVPSLLTAGISDEDAQTRATSSITMTVAIASAPAPPYSSGMCTACRSALTSASCASCGNCGYLVDLGRVRGDLVVGELAHRLAERLVLFGQGEGGKVMAHDPIVGVRDPRRPEPG